MKVYVVESGQYSDRSIEAVYSNQEAADQHAAAYDDLTYDGAHVYEFELLDEAVVPFASVVYHLYLNKAEYGRPERDGEYHHIHWGDDPVELKVEYGDRWLVSVKGPDLEQVRKVYGDVKAGFLAERAGLT